MHRVESFVADLRAAGYAPARVVLFGSYAKGRPRETSDIDLAVWDKRFTGCGTADIAPIAHLVSKYPQLEVHTFALDDTPETNPFAGEVLRHGINVA
jgi:predicted nucleotidyltransferase